MEMLKHARKYGLFLFVTITMNKKSKSFKMTVDEYKRALKRYKAFYGLVIVSQYWNDYKMNVVFDNGIKFNTILY